MPEQAGGIEKTVSLAWGGEFRAGFVGIGAEFQDNAALTYGQRRWTAG